MPPRSPAEANRPGLCAGQSRAVPLSGAAGTLPWSTRALCHGAHALGCPRPAAECLHSLLPVGPRPSGLRVGPSPPGLAAQGEGRPSRAFRALRAGQGPCLVLRARQLRDSGDLLQGALRAGQEPAGNLVLELLFSADLCWHALAAGGLRRMTRV